MGIVSRIKFKAGEDYELMLSKLATNSGEIAKKALGEGACIIADEIRKNLVGVLSDNATGQLLDSFGISKVRDYEGVWKCSVGFDGYDDKGVANQLKARALESGTSTRRAHPFVRPAIRAKKAAAEQRMNEVIAEEIQKIGGKR